MVPEHLREVRTHRLSLIDKTYAAVKDRLTKEINYWDYRASVLEEDERAGRHNARLNSREARRRADELHARLQRRLEQLSLEGQISALPPVGAGRASDRAERGCSRRWQSAAGRRRSGLSTRRSRGAPALS